MAEIVRLRLETFRNYSALDIEFGNGRIVIEGSNGQGKSNLIEAIAYLGTLGSFRGAPTEALIGSTSPRAIIRADVVKEGRELLVEAEISRERPNRLQVNKQRVSPARDVIGLVPVTVFGPDDLALVKEGPSVRRRYLDDLLVQLSPRNVGLRAELDRILKQRNALLRQARGRLTPEIHSTLVVWNSKFSEVGEAWGRARQQLVETLSPEVTTAYAALAGVDQRVEVAYSPAWLATGLGPVLDEVRDDEVRRGRTLVGPQRDELDLVLASMPARTHASQGEQRTAALAMRIAGHRVLAKHHETSPLLLLDDVFSELDRKRSEALLGLLEAEQTFVTSAVAVDVILSETSDATRFHVDRGQVSRVNGQWQAAGSA